MTSCSCLLGGTPDCWLALLLRGRDREKVARRRSLRQRSRVSSTPRCHAADQVRTIGVDGSREWAVDVNVLKLLQERGFEIVLLNRLLHCWLRSQPMTFITECELKILGEQAPIS
jgi:hypothetical protein